MEFFFKSPIRCKCGILELGFIYPGSLFFEIYEQARSLRVGAHFFPEEELFYFQVNNQFIINPEYQIVTNGNAMLSHSADRVLRWWLNTGNAAHVTDQLNFNLYLILIHL